MLCWARCGDWRPGARGGNSANIVLTQLLCVWSGSQRLVLYMAVLLGPQRTAMYVRYIPRVAYAEWDSGRIYLVLNLKKLRPSRIMQSTKGRAAPLFCPHAHVATKPKL